MSVRRAAVWLMAAQYVNFLVQFATSVIISRLYLLPADVGLFSIALAAAMMLAIFQDMGFSRFITGQPEMKPEHLRDYAAVTIITGWLVAALIALCAWPLSLIYQEVGLGRLILIIAGSYFLVPLAIVPAALLTRALDFKALFLANASSALFGSLVTIGTAAQGQGAAAMAWGMLASAALRLVIVFAARPVLPRLPRSLSQIRPMLNFGGHSFMLSLSGAIGMRSQDLIVGRLLGVGATGLFTRAGALAGQLSSLIVGAINGVFYPAFARKRDAGEDLADPYTYLVACNTALQWPAAVGLALAAEPVVALLYGPHWQEVAGLLRWTALAELFLVAIPLQMDIPILLGRIRPLVWVNLADTVLTVGLLAIFCLGGVQSAAIGRVAIGAVWFAIYIIFIGRALRLDARRLANVYLKSAVCAGAAGMPLALANWSGLGGPSMDLFRLFTLVLAGVASWLIALPLVGHPAWQEFRRVAERLPIPYRRHPLV